jgi:hypothetical protein
VCLQILQERNLLFQFIEHHSIHGLLASIGRIWQSAPRSQARMMGVPRKWSLWAPTLIQHHRLSNLRAFTLRLNQSEREKNTALRCCAASHSL